MKKSQIWKINIRRKINKIDLDEDHLFFALTLVVGVLSGAVAVFIAKSIHFLTDYFQTHEAPTPKSIAAGAAFVFISGYITSRWATNTAGSGIPQTKIALVVYHGKITFKDWFAKLITSILSLSSGITLGREGPTVTVTAGIGSSIGTMFSLSKVKIKALVAVGAAGGIAAAFNAPIAAVTFTLEEVVGNLNAKALGPIIIASVAAAVTAKVLTGGEPVFDILHYRFERPSELVFYLIIGILAAIIGPLWMKSVLKTRELNLKIFKGHRLTTMLTAFAIVAVVSFFFPEVLGSGHHLINETLHSNLTGWQTISILFGLKFILTTICYSSGISGGLFMPTLFMGAMVGALVGVGANAITPEANEIGAFALVGMGAFFAAVIRAPFTSILIIFEMTQDYTIILPLMVANITAYMFSQKFAGGSIYEKISEQDGIHLPTKEDYDVLETLTVEDAMIREVKTLNGLAKIKDALKVINHSEISGYPVLKGDKLIGVVSSSEVGQAYAKFEGECLVESIATCKIMTVYADQSLLMAFHYLKQFRVSRLVVVSRLDDKRLVGIITAEDIVNSFGYHVQEDSKYDVIDNCIKEAEAKANSSDKADEDTTEEAPA